MMGLLTVLLFLLEEYPGNPVDSKCKSQGLIYSRNRLLRMTTDFAVSIDDDLHCDGESLEIISYFFYSESRSWSVGFRIFWSKSEPVNTTT
jgi:hypothetical protein